MGLCVLEGTGGGSNASTAKEMWAEQNITFVDKQFNLGNPAGGNTMYRGIISCDMSDVIPEGQNILFAVFSATNGGAGGDSFISSVSGRTVNVDVGYSYNNGVYVTIRAYYLVSGSTVPFTINNATHYYDIGNQIGSNTTARKDIDWCTVDTVLPPDAVIVGYGFYRLGNQTGTIRNTGITNRTPLFNIGYSYNYGVWFTVQAYYI